MIVHGQISATLSSVRHAASENDHLRRNRGDAVGTMPPPKDNSNRPGPGASGGPKTDAAGNSSKQGSKPTGIPPLGLIKAGSMTRSAGLIQSSVDSVAGVDPRRSSGILKPAGGGGGTVTSPGLGPNEGVRGSGGKRVSISGSLSSSLQPTPRFDRFSTQGPIIPETDVFDVGAGEARRNADGSVAKLIDQISDDDGDEDNELLMAGRHGSGNSFFMANALESLQDAGSSTSSVMLRAKSWRSSMTAVKASVEQHQQRLMERQQVFSGLRSWADKYSDATGAPVDDSHVDADQMDLGDELRKRDRPDPTGVGAALRMHWQECVKEETEKQLEAVREQWDEERRVELEEIAQLREQNKVMKTSLAEYKEQCNALSGKMELLQRQIKGQGLEAIDPAPPATDPSPPFPPVLEPPQREEKPTEATQRPEDEEEIADLKAKLEKAETALEAADKEADALHQQLQEAEERVLAAERAAEEAAAAVAAAQIAAAVAAGDQGTADEIASRVSSNGARRSSNGMRRSSMGGGGSRRSSAGAGGLSIMEIAALQHDLDEMSAENEKLSRELQDQANKADELEKTLKEASAKLVAVSKEVPLVDPEAAKSELSQRLQGEVDRLTAEVDRLSFEAVSKQPALKQIGIELELERGKRQELAQAVEDGIDMQMSQLKQNARNAGQDVHALHRLLKETDVRMRQMANNFMSEYAPNPGSPKAAGASGGRRRRILGLEELKNLLASSTLKMQELIEIGGLSVPAEFLMGGGAAWGQDEHLGHDDSFDEVAFEAAAAAEGATKQIQAAMEGGKGGGYGNDQYLSQSADLEEFSPRIAKLIATRKQPSGTLDPEPILAGRHPSLMLNRPGSGGMSSHPQYRRLQAPSVPRLRMSVTGTGELLMLSNRSGVTSSNGGTALASTRSDGSRDENDVPVYRKRGLRATTPGMLQSPGIPRDTSADGAVSSVASLSLVPPQPAMKRISSTQTIPLQPAHDNDDGGVSPVARGPTHGDQQGGGTSQHKAIRFSESVNVLTIEEPPSPSIDLFQSTAQRPWSQAGGGVGEGTAAAAAAAEDQRQPEDVHLSSMQPRFAPPGEVRPRSQQRVSIQEVNASNGGGGGTKRPGDFVKRLAGSFHRLHGAYLNLRSLPEVDSPTEAGQAMLGSLPPHMAQHQQHLGSPINLPPIGQQLIMSAEEALQPVLSVRGKPVVGRGGGRGNGSPTGAAASGLFLGPEGTLQRPRTAGVAEGAGSYLFHPSYHVDDAYGPGPSAKMVAGLGSDASWRPLGAPPPRPKSAVQFRRREGLGAIDDYAGGDGSGVDPRHRSESPPPRASGVQYSRPLSAAGSTRPTSPLRPPSPLRQGPYGPSGGMGQGGYLVRNITATPQKGFMVRAGGRAVSGRPGEGLRHNSAHQQQQAPPPGTRWSFGKFVVLDEGQGTPQLPPGPVTLTSVTMSGFSMGLNAPMMSMGMGEVQQRGFQMAGGESSSTGVPSGGLMQQQWATEGSSRFAALGGGGRYSTVELMTRVELIHQMRHMQQAHDGMMQRLLVTLKELERTEGVQQELIQEVQESREHWVAENQYNAMLQEELERMRTILSMVSGAPAEEALALAEQKGGAGEGRAVYSSDFEDN